MQSSEKNKIKIYSIHYNKPEYIELQSETLKKFVHFPYEFIILDNSINPELKTQIDGTCGRLDLRRIDCFNSILGMSSHSHQNSFKYLLNDVSDGDSIMILDHDLFLHGDLHEDYFHDYDLVMLPQTRGLVEYPWPGMLILKDIKDKNQISFKSGAIEGESCDTGGELYYYIKNNNLRVKRVKESYIDEGSKLISNLDDIFIHLISGSDWNKNYDLGKKIDLLLSLIRKDQ